MIILTIRTNKPEAEVGLFDNDKKLAYEKWEAPRSLSETIHQKIHKLLKHQQKDWKDIDGIVCYQGPGSFTGLRIGLSVGNALAYSLNISIVAAGGKDWIKNGIKALRAGKNQNIVLPRYGSPAHITSPKK